MSSIRKTFYTVESLVDSKIVLISDIHYHDAKMKKFLNKIINQVKLVNPNYICIPGDFIDQRTIEDKEIFLEFLRMLGLISPVLISIGNHDVKNKKEKHERRNKKLFSDIEELPNVYLLDNTSWVDGNLCFTGLTLPWYSYQEKHDSYKKTLATLNKYYEKGLGKRNKYHIVLSHSPLNLIHPEVITHKFYKDADLILSGHTHGGLAPKLFLKIFKRGITTPKRHLFPKYVYGYIKEKKTIISSGITKLSHVNPFRHLNFIYPGEMVIITLKKEES